jgi:hypothetical protein
MPANSSITAFLFHWPLPDILKSFTCLALIYLSRDHIRLAMLRCQAYHRYLHAQLINDRDKNLAEIKHLMFQEAFKLLSAEQKQDNPVNILEISMGCGENFVHLPKSSALVGIEANSLCEKFARKRLDTANRATGNGVVLREFLVGYGESLACVRSGSMGLVFCTNTEGIGDWNEANKEIYRVLAKVNLKFLG